MSTLTEPTGEYHQHQRDKESNATPSPDEVVSLLGDEYTHKIVEAMGDREMSAREIHERTDMSRPTIYRRISDLKESGMIETRTRIDGDGHHKEIYRLAIDEVTISIADLAS